MKEFFKGIKGIEEVKKHFRNLAMQHHPDKGGDAEIMKQINNEYHEALKQCEREQNGAEEHTYKYNEDIENEIMSKLFEVMKLRSLEIALIGFWIWVSGDTKNNKEALKTMGFIWHQERKLWYYRPQGWKRSRRSNLGLDAIAQRYGYRGFQTADKQNMPKVI